jgi:hypothetical protein
VAKRWKPDTPEKVILGVLLYEFSSDEQQKSQAKIKRRLRYHQLGPYDQERVDVLRRLKDSLQQEISGRHRSRYYLGTHGRYAAMEDLDVARIVEDYSKAFPTIARSEIEWFVPNAVYTYYLR